MIKIILFLTILFLQSCVSTGPDYGPVKRFCKKRNSEFKEGNPIYFTCKDGTQWEKHSKDQYKFHGNESEAAE